MTDFIGSWPILRVNGESLERLMAVMALSDQKKFEGYAIDTNNGRIVFFGYKGHKDATPFPTSMSGDFCAQLAIGWLKEARYPAEPDHDGDNSKGWLCYTENWGHIEPYGFEASLAVEPHWLIYGK